MFQDNVEFPRRSMMGLSYGEQLVVWGIRKIVAAQGPDSDLLVEFQAAFGCEGEEGLRMFCSFFRLLGHAARRPYEIAPLSTLLVTRDEQRILILLAAAQRGVASNDQALFRAHLLWIAAEEHRQALSRIALVFANLLTAHGHPVSLARDVYEDPPVMPYVPVRAIEGHSNALWAV